LGQNKTAVTPIRIKEHHSDFTFTFDGGRLKAEGEVYLQGKQSFSFDLDQISGSPITIERRYPTFRSGAWTAIFSIIGIALLSRFDIGDFGIVAICFLGALTLIGIIVMIVSIRPIKIITVTNQGGQALFTIIRTHKNANEVDELLSILSADKGEATQTKGEPNKS
jgi:hypothetical protein